MIKQLFFLATLLITLNACDIKKAGVNGQVIKKTTGAPMQNVLVSFIQCKTNGDNCDEVFIGQAYTNDNGEFVIEKKTGSKSKTKWITVHNGSKKIAQVDNVGLNDKNIIIEAP